MTMEKAYISFDLPRWQQIEHRIKRLMTDLGMPDSTSLYVAMGQLVRDVEHIDRNKATPPAPSVEVREKAARALAQKFPTTFTPYGNEKGPNAFAFNVVDFILSSGLVAPAQEGWNEAKDKEIAYQAGLIHRLQAALMFWMPGVTEAIEIELSGRAGDDAQLLAGYSGKFPAECWGDKMVARLAALAEQEEKNG